MNAHRSHRRHATIAASAAVILLGATACGGTEAEGGSAEDYPSEPLSIMVPASPGGGYDQLARSVQQSLTESGLVEDNIQVYNVPGAGGTAGLTQFVSEHEGDPHQLMAMGLVLVGSQKTTAAPVTVEGDATPVAELASEYITFVVREDSPFTSLSDFVEKIKADPASVNIGGSSSGSIEHVVMGTLAEAIGVDPTELNYVPYESGGEQTTSLLSGDTDITITGISETKAQLDSGEMRALVVTSDEPIEGVDAPTFLEEGYDESLVVANWRGLLAPPGITDEEQAAIVDLLDQMRESPEWTEILETRGWDDTFKGGEEFETHLQSESDRMEQALKSLGLIDG